MYRFTNFHLNIQKDSMASISSTRKMYIRIISIYVFLIFPIAILKKLSPQENEFLVNIILSLWLAYFIINSRTSTEKSQVG